MKEQRVGMRGRRGAVIAATLLTALEAPALPVQAEVMGATPAVVPAPAPLLAQANPGGSLELRVRRQGDVLDLVIEGTGPAPQLQQSSSGSTWQGRLITATPNGLRRGPQRLSLPEAGLQSISFDGSGTVFRLDVTPVPGFPVGRPVVSADGRNLILSFSAPPQASLQTLRPNLDTPGRVAQPGFVPPLQPRAVAPPVGDMAVGTMMISNPSYLNVSGPPVTMTLKNAPARDVLMALSQLGGYGFVYVDDTQTAAAPAAPQSLRPISISFRNESYGRALNSALLAAGLQGKRDGNMILAGPKVLSKSFGAQMSKVYRLNQVSANSAADYLANLGASVTKTNTITTAVTQGINQNSAVANAPSSATTQSSSQTTVEAYGAGVGPLVGLLATTDTRLSTITLVGAPAIVSIAEQYLKQLDVRQRQVALAVKILDISLNNDTDIANDFAFRWGNNFIVNDGGQLLGAFGRFLPPTYNQLTGFSPQTENPSLQYPRDNFFDFIRAQIVSENTKLLASPTLILQENPSELRSDSGVATATDASGALDSYSIDSPIGRRRANEAAVRVGTNVIVEFTTDSAATTSTASNVITCTPTLATAGLVLGARVDKIDDNGFVTFALSPSVSAVTDTSLVPGCGSIAILSVRRLDTGSVRVRDGQTLILTGVISDFDRAQVTKWPILGDIPLVGQFFRSSNNTREKRELVIMVTPRIINDSDGGQFGYGYQPSPSQSRELLRSPGS